MLDWVVITGSGCGERRNRSVEATLEPGASIARVARKHGVNANQVFQWRHEYCKGAFWVGKKATTELLPVTLSAEVSNPVVSEAESQVQSSSQVQPASIHIELPGRALVSIEGHADRALVQAVLKSLIR